MKRLLHLADVVSERVRNAATSASAKLTQEGVGHALIGGLAVGVYGHARATRDVDFLVARDARHLVSGRLLGGGAEGVMVRHAGVVVDLLFQGDDEDFLTDAIEHGALTEEGLRVVPTEALVLLKLKRGSRKDQEDIRELLRRGRLKEKLVQAYLSNHRPDLVEEFEGLVTEVDVEEGRR